MKREKAIQIANEICYNDPLVAVNEVNILINQIFDNNKEILDAALKLHTERKKVIGNYRGTKWQGEQMMVVVVLGYVDGLSIFTKYQK